MVPGIEVFLGSPRSATCWPLPTSAAHVFYIFLTWFRKPIFSDFGANLAPTWHSTWDQNRPQTVNKAIKKRIKMLINCSINFWMALGTIFSEFGLEVGRPKDPKTFKNQWENQQFWEGPVHDEWWQLAERDNSSGFGPVAMTSTLRALMGGQPDPWGACT